MKKHKYNDFVRWYAKHENISFAKANPQICAVFDAIREIVLFDRATLTIPDFGTFRPVKTKGGKRNICGQTVEIAKVTRVAFRASKNARVQR